MEKDINLIDKFRDKLREVFPSEEWTPKLVTALRSYNKEKFVRDLMAGLVVGIVALPLAMAFGIASGVKPEQGLITAIIAGFIVSAIGGSSVQVAGPTGAFIVIVYNCVVSYGVEGLLVATIMAGVMLVLMGVLKLGVVIRFIPYPIIVGFMSGIAVTIFSTQMPDFFGLKINETIPADFISKWEVYFRHINTIDWLTLAVGTISLLIIVFTPRFSKKVPGSLLAVIVVSIVVSALKAFGLFDSVLTIGDKFEIASDMPQMQSNMGFSIALVREVFPTAFTIALLGAIESLISASIADGVTGDRHQSNLELVAQGFANIFSGAFGGIPATGALARTMTNVNNGGRSPVAGIIHAVFLLFIMLFFGWLISNIPLVCLAAVLIIVSYNMSEWRSFVDLLKNSKSDVAILLTTFFLTIIFDLTIAIEVGILLAVFSFMKRMNEVSGVSIIRDEIDLSGEMDSSEDFKFTLPEHTEIFEIDGPFFFGLANKFDESMRTIGDKSKVRIIRMRKVPFIDSTGLMNLQSLCEKSIEDKMEVILSGVRPEVFEMIERSPIPRMIGGENICTNIRGAISRAYDIIAEQDEQRKEAEEKERAQAEEE